MSILTDRQIAQRCLPPNFIVQKTLGLLYPDRWCPKHMHLSKDDVNIIEWKNRCLGENHPDNLILTRIDEGRIDLPPMISPYHPSQVRKVGNTKIISFGTSSMGYDVTLADKFKVFSNMNPVIVDPLSLDPRCYVESEGKELIIPPNGYALGYTKEYFVIPRNIVTICLGKSTYARAVLGINVTPIEPGFEGNVVIEMVNHSPLPVKVYADMGISQFLYLESEEDCITSYGDRGGKYQGQRGLQDAIV